MPTKAIRGVSDEGWSRLKSRANEHGLSIGRFIMKLSEESGKTGNKARWEEILSWRAKDPKEVKGIEKRIKEIRKGFRLREFK
ncbi:hypothetical protein HYV82_00850 [Candidatus Woesearchaeota archaeon]|nr:hypothetical protein [Candidatus Woesearchaeota archaeon]